MFIQVMYFNEVFSMLQKEEKMAVPRDLLMLSIILAVDQFYRQLGTTIICGAFTYDVRFLGRQVLQAPSDFTLM